MNITNNNIFIRLFSLLTFGKVKIGGTITTLSPTDDYPTHIANLGVGGLHSYDTLADVADIPTGRLQVSMLASVTQSNKLYKLHTLLPDGVDRVSDIPSYNLLDYWEEVSVQGEPGEDGVDGDPLLSIAFTANSQITDSLVSGNQFLPENTDTYSSWIPLTNNMTIDRHLLIRYWLRGYNPTVGSSIITAHLQFGSDGVTEDLNLGVGSSWDSVVEFRGNIGGQSIPNQVEGFSINRIPANTTLYFRIKYTSQDKGIMIDEHKLYGHIV